MKIISIFYTNNKFRHRKNILKEKLFKLGFDDVIAYDEDWLKTTPFYVENEEMLKSPIGAGYWLWKPFIILCSFNLIDENDIVCYFDAGDELNNGIVNKIKDHMQSNDYIFTTWIGHGINITNTKRDCFILMDCDSEIYYNAPHVEAGCVVVRKNEANAKILNDWLFYCKNKNIVTDEPSIYGKELNMFGRHHHDQSVLSNIIKKNNLNCTDILMPYIKYNYYMP